MNPKVEEIYTILKRRRYNREKPFREEELKERIADFVSQNIPIEVVGFWGVGPRASTNWADKETCEFLSDLDKAVTETYPPGIRFIFVFAEPHGMHNGIPEHTMNAYIGDMKQLFAEHGFQYRHLQPLWEEFGISFEKIEQLWKEKPEGWWATVPNHEDIEENARRRNHRLPALKAAQYYAIMRDLEKEMWESTYPTAIFHAFSDAALRAVLPDMPTLYLYGRKGYSNAPWFVTTCHKNGKDLVALRK